jgi:hypothetical protein
MDLRCDVCGHVETDHYEQGGLGDYGSCIMCLQFNEEGKLGTMRQVFAIGGFTMGKISNIGGTTGRTSNGTKWEILDRPRKYDYVTKKFSGEVL